jgi:pimeloyl-ACP methyl ester carboxylesterase
VAEKSLGDSIYLHVEGAGAETIVMVHGWPDTYRLWDGVVEALKDRFRCVRFTLPGFDASLERRAYALGEVLEALDRIVERANPGGKVILMLHDWGCVLGYEYAMRHPERVSRIVGVDIGDPASWKRTLTAMDKLKAMSYQVWLALAWMIGGGVGDAMTRFMARLAKCPSDPAPMNSGMNYSYFLIWFGSRESFRGQLHRFDPACPMLFVYGRRKFVMFHARAWAEALAAKPGNRVEEFATGHWVMSDDPVRFNQVVLAWLSSAVP